ncbi:DUF72 domain-containing protein [Vibrio variabilis]|uniref:DUF72 domain-containing protein n=1 Tax=Vibrio variabilis TaxID=990271 RepID=UPI000DD63E45|nr:DUF72 domain-containing protein [Vibrio variabilis]
MSEPTLRLGLTMWSHNDWQHSFYGKGTKPGERLARYASVFDTVEGNTTFYATPSAKTVASWNDATSEDFRFTFKLPKAITHERMLNQCQDELMAFLQVMAPLHNKVGMWTIQLPSKFSPADLPALQAFCAKFPSEMKLGVEVRHLGFFNKSEEERVFNQWLMEHHIDRIIMDSRPVFAAAPTTAAVIDAHDKKPKVPVHAIATADHPMIRFIGHPDMEANLAFFKPWEKKLAQWIEQGKQPYLMIHTPDNVEAPELAIKLYKELKSSLAGNITLSDKPTFPCLRDDHQISMF